MATKLYGKYRGFVADNNDPMKLRRLRVKVPALFGDEILEWAWPCEPYGGLGEMAACAVPEPGAGVWVEFEAGDPSSPIWSGCWSGAPGGSPEVPEEAKAGYPANKVFKTKSGHVAEFDDTQGKERIKITCKDRSFLEFDSDTDKPRVIVQDKNGDYLLFDMKAGQQKIEVLAGPLRMVLDKETNELIIESPVRVKVDAPEVLLGQGTLSGVTTAAHPCLFLGAPHPGSSQVKAGN